jgi:hypothetical protein
VTWPKALTPTSIWRARFTIFGVIAIIVGLAISAKLASDASSETPPSAAQSALFVVVAGLFQVAGTGLFAYGRPSQDRTRTTLRHLGKTLEKIVEAKVIAETALDDGTATVTRAAVGELSFRLDTIEQQLTTELEDWSIGHPALVHEKFLEEQK